MSAVTSSSHTATDHGHGHQGVSAAEYRFQLRSNRLGLWLFFGSEAFMFAGLLVTRFFLWGNTRPNLDQIVGLIITTILLISSYFMNRAEIAIANNQRSNFIVSLIITVIFGTAFLLGVMIFEWQVISVPWYHHEHILPSDGTYGAVLYGMTGMHALHVVSGIVFILIVLVNALRGHFSPERHWGVESCAIWWHYVDLVWVFFYPALYLMGSVIQ